MRSRDGMEWGGDYDRIRPRMSFVIRDYFQCRYSRALSHIKKPDLDDIHS